MGNTQTQSKVDERRQKAMKAAEERRRSKLVKSSTALQPYGTPEELGEMMLRVRWMVQGGDKLNDAQIWKLAQGAYALGLNPVAKEICLVGDNLFPQIRGVRRKGREQITIDWGMSPPNFDFVQIIDPLEREAFRIPEGALAYKAVGRIKEERTAWAQDAKILRDALGPEAPYEVILSEIGEMPRTIGIGYITQEEMWEKDNPRWWHVCREQENNTERIKDKQQYVLRGHEPCPDCGRESWATVNRYPHDQCARKRAEAHFWYQKTDLPFDISPSGEGFADFEGDELIKSQDYEGDFIEATFDDVPEWVNTPELLEKYLEMRAEAAALNEEKGELSEEELRAQAQAGAADLFDAPPEPTPKAETKVANADEPQPVKKKSRSWAGEYIDAIKEAEIVPPDAQGRQLAPRIVNALNRSPFSDGDPIAWIKKWLDLRYKLRAEGVDADTADEQATAMWVAGSDDKKDIKAAFGEDWYKEQVKLAKTLLEA